MFSLIHFSYRQNNGNQGVRRLDLVVIVVFIKSRDFQRFFEKKSENKKN